LCRFHALCRFSCAGRLGLAGRLRRAVIAGFAFDNDEAGARELVAEPDHRSLDLVKISESHHAEGRYLIRLPNLDALLLEKGPQDQGVPEVGALNRPSHIHISDTPFSCEGASRIVAGPVSFPAFAGCAGPAGWWRLWCPCPVMSTQATRSLS
jgi:hypothetical protein